jgi:hypothetical protein
MLGFRPLYGNQEMSDKLRNESRKKSGFKPQHH